MHLISDFQIFPKYVYEVAIVMPKNVYNHITCQTLLSCEFMPVYASNVYMCPVRRCVGVFFVYEVVLCPQCANLLNLPWHSKPTEGATCQWNRWVCSIEELANPCPARFSIYIFREVKLRPCSHYMKLPGLQKLKCLCTDCVRHALVLALIHSLDSLPSSQGLCWLLLFAGTF